MADGVIYDESSGIYKGILTEDMIDTFQRVKRSFISVKFESLFSEELFPLTYVPEFYRTLPLREGDTVWCQFSQGEMAYPVLYKVKAEMPDEMLELPDAPDDGQFASFPSLDKLVAVQRLNESCYLFCTEGQVYLWTGSGHHVFASDEFFSKVSKFNVLCSDVTVEADGGVDIEAGGEITVMATTQKVTVGNSTDTLGGILCDLIETMVSATTMGSPYQHTMSADTIASLSQLLATCQAVLG